MRNNIHLLQFPQAEQELIQKHLDLVLRANKTHNLTRITSADEAQLLHIEDSLVAFPEIQQAPKGKYADLGSGGGYPGIPLAITTHRQTVLVDSVQKKAKILSHIVNELGIEESVDVFAGRIEELAAETPAAFSVLTARALSSLPSLLELAAPLLVHNGHFISYKAIVEQNELDSALSLSSQLGMRLISDRAVTLGLGNIERRILVFEKFKNSEMKLPRRVGLAQKRPLC